VKEGASVIVLGPRSSLVLEEASSDILFFGDETTIGLASALKENKAASKLAFFFEANSLEESRLILQRFSLTESSLYPLLSHEKVAMDLKKSFDDNREATIILSGKQQSIVAIREKLYALGVPAEKIIIKVYWGWKDDPKGKLKK
jgi:NADPH-dependent ferric siderophore reductase